MMQVKGTGIKTTRDFVKTRFPGQFDEWVQQLPMESRMLFTGPLDVGSWYKAPATYFTPSEKIAELLYNRNQQKAGDELGRYSAEVALKGIYKVFLLVATPQYLMKRSASMMQAFYNPSEIEVTELTKKQVQFTIKKFEGINKVTEFRIAGWCSRALELCNCQQVKYQITSSLSGGQPQTIINFSWE